MASTGRAATMSGRTDGWLFPLIVLITGMFMSMLDTSVVNVAIPRMRHSLGASPDDIMWVVTGYTLTLGVVVPLSAWLGDRLGVTRLYMGSLLGFTVASVLCGMAWDLHSMIFFRILQAIPGGILPVVSLTMLYRIVPLEKIGTAMGVYGLGVVLAPTLGPALGGYLTEYLDWRLVFYLNAPIGVLGAILATAVLPRIHATTWRRFDLWGFVTIAYGLFALLLAADKGEDWGWASYPVLILLVSSALGLALFVVIEFEVESPLLDLRVLRVWAYVNSLLLISILMVGVFAALYYLPLYLQVIQGMGALDAGLVMMSPAVAMAVTMLLGGQLYDKIGPRWPAVVGLFLTALGCYWTAHITPNMSPSDLILWSAVRVVGVGLCMMPIMTGGLSALQPAQTAAGSAMSNVMQRVSSGVGLAIFGGLVNSQQAQMLSDRVAIIDSSRSPILNQAAEQGARGLLPIYLQLQKSGLTTAYANVFLVVAALSLIGCALALLLRTGPAKPADGQPAAVPRSETRAQDPTEPARRRHDEEPDPAVAGTALKSVATGEN